MCGVAGPAWGRANSRKPIEGRSRKRSEPREMADDEETTHYDGPAGGWGSLRGIGRIYRSERSRPAALNTLRRQNKPGGFMCVSCAWTKPAHSHPFEFCENGAKATLWELTSRRCTPEFFEKHAVTELKSWRDYDLEEAGRLTHPMRYDPASDGAGRPRRRCGRPSARRGPPATPAGRAPPAAPPSATR